MRAVIALPFAWLIVFACFIRAAALLWLTMACLLLYLVPAGAHLVRPGGGRTDACSNVLPRGKVIKAWRIRA